MTADPQVLHTQLLDKISEEISGADYYGKARWFQPALVGALKLHTPVTEVNPSGEAYTACDHCGYGDDGYPCETVKIIASALGVET